MTPSDNRSMFAKIFIAMMIYCGLVWAWTIALIMSWPWEKTTVWQPEFHVAVVCQDGKVCGIPYGLLDEAKLKGLYSTLVIPSDSGDIAEASNRLKWQKKDGVIEVKATSWHFQTTVRYTVEDEKPVLIGYQDVGPKALFYGMAAGLFSLIGIYLRKLRR